MYKGIDYGLGRSNINDLGIRFGVIPQNAVGQVWYEESIPHYGKPTCPKCGSEALELPCNDEEINANSLLWKYEADECDDYCCIDCKYVFGNESAYPEEPYSFYFEDEVYSAECSDEVDIFILKSPYFTYAQFCSPCAPGAIYLLNPIEDMDSNNKAYCFSPDWFTDDIAPYPVYSIKTGEKIK